MFKGVFISCSAVFGKIKMFQKQMNSARSTMFARGMLIGSMHYLINHIIVTVCYVKTGSSARGVCSSLSVDMSTHSLVGARCAGEAGTQPSCLGLMVSNVLGAKSNQYLYNIDLYVYQYWLMQKMLGETAAAIRRVG